jgi:radical SAM superfamily enzyme YgiQ (UPF0313 family)
MYRTKRFRAVSFDEFCRDLDEAASQIPAPPRRVFLADGDAMCLSTERLLAVLDRINAKFPRLQRIGIYANARDINRRTDEELREIRARKLRMVYVGLESGDEQTLAAVDKGATAGEIVNAVRRAQGVGISASVMVLIGLAGRERSLAHARASAAAINEMAPTFTALLTYTPTPGSFLGEAYSRGDFELPGPLESLEEIREFVANLACRTYFTCNHASNYLPMTGSMPESREQILAMIDAAIRGDVRLKPEFLRGL